MLNVLEELEQRLYDEDIEVYIRDFKVTKAIAMRIGDRKAIGYDKNKIESTSDLRVTLEHEYEHLNQPKTMYDFDTSVYAMRRREGIVNRNLIKRLLPFETLKPFLEVEKRTFEIAEELNLTEQFIIDAINYYITLGMNLEKQ